MKNVAKRAVNTVTAVFSQNLTWVCKPKEGQTVGETKHFSEEQTFTTDTLTEITSRKVGLWLIGTLKHFIRLSRLQGRTGFKMSKPVDLVLSVNNKTENLSFKFTLSVSRIQNLLEKYPAIVTEAFQPAPSIGNITAAQVQMYFTNAENLVIAPAAKVKALENSDNAVIEETITEVVVPLIEA